MKSSKKIILFNGPPSSGKDTAALILKEFYGDRSIIYKFATPLKDSCHSILGFDETYTKELELLKDAKIGIKVNKEYNNFPVQKTLVDNNREMSLRQFYIHIGENVIKPMFGKYFFGDMAVKKINNASEEIVLIPDCGFVEEVIPLLKEFTNIYLVRLNKSNCNFVSDSRSYIRLPIKSFDIHNNGIMDEYKNIIIKTFSNIL